MLLNYDILLLIQKKPSNRGIGVMKERMSRVLKVFRFRNHSKIYFSFIASYLIFSIILLAISFSYASVLRQKLVTEYNNSYRYTLSVFADEFKQLTDSLSFSVSLALKNIDSYDDKYGIETVFNSEYQDKGINESFSDILISNNQYICQLGIYFPQQRAVLSNRGVQNASDYFTSNYSKNDSLCSDWQTQLNGNQAYFIYEHLNSRYLYYRYNTQINFIPAVIFSCADLQKCYNGIKEIYNSANANIVLYNKNSEIILADENFADSFQKYLDTGNPNLNVLKSSGAPGWTIYLLNDDAFYTSSVRNINILMYLIIIIYLILVLFMSAYFSKLHYTPIRTLTESLGGSVNPIKTNEFTFLQNSINTLVYKNNAYIRKNIQNEKINNLKRFILGKETEVPSALSELNSENDINSLWCVAMLKITHTSAEKLKELGYSQTDTDTIFVNICEEVISREYRIIVFPSEDCYCLLISGCNLKKSGLEILFNQIIKAIGFYFDTNFAICASTICGGCRAIPKLYKDASEIMVITEFLRPEQSQIRFYDDLTNESKHKTSNAAMRNKLNAFIHNNNPDMASELINAVIDTSMNNITSADMFNEITHEILILLTYTVDSLFESNNEPVPDKYVPIHRIFPYKSINELKDNIHKYLIALCDYAQPKYEETPLEQKIVKYIKENYSNPNLDATTICEIFHIHNTHLSRLFTENFNIGMHQYLTQLRVEKAKNMLTSSTEKIETIAEEVGYNNIYSFSRAFKRITGISPRQYRADNNK